MERTITIHLASDKVLRLIQELEALQLIRIVTEQLSPAKTKLSDKYKGVFTKEDAASFDEHTQKMRG